MFLKKSRFFVFLMTLLLGVVLIGCQTTTSTTKGDFALAGEYEIDIEKLGMPLVFYLKINSDQTFKLSSNRQYDVDKGNGTVGQSGDTYMLLYSDSTPDTPRNATFTVVNGNLAFSTNLPYGSSNISFMKVDEDDPEITHYLVAKIYAHESYLKEYAGSHSVAAMGGEILYEYSMVLKPGREYSFISEFDMGGDHYVYEEFGTFQIVDNVITITPHEQTAVEGTIQSDGSIQIGVKPSQMGSRAVRTLQVTTTAQYAGTYYGHKQRIMGTTVMYDTSITIKLDKFGKYTYKGVDSQSGTINEQGSYQVTGSTITFTIQDSETTHSGTIQNYILTASFILSTESTNRGEVLTYRSNVIGEFTSTTSVDEVEYQSTLSLQEDGTYQLTILGPDSTVVLEEEGTFVIQRTMLVNVNLTSGSTTRSFVLSTASINGNVEVNSVTYGFTYRK